MGNSLSPGPDCEKVTYYELYARPMDLITPRNFSMLDPMLLPLYCTHRLLTICSDRGACIASHHFPVTATIDVTLTKYARPHKAQQVDWATLQCPEHRTAFVRALDSEIRHGNQVAEALDERWRFMCESVATVATTVLPELPARHHKPWISSSTLRLIQDKREARSNGRWQRELALAKEVRKDV